MARKKKLPKKLPTKEEVWSAAVHLMEFAYLYEYHSESFNDDEDRDWLLTLVETVDSLKISYMTMIRRMQRYLEGDIAEKLAEIYRQVKLKKKEFNQKKEIEQLFKSYHYPLGKKDLLSLAKRPQDITDVSDGASGSIMCAQKSLTAIGFLSWRKIHGYRKMKKRRFEFDSRLIKPISDDLFKLEVVAKILGVSPPVASEVLSFVEARTKVLASAPKNKAELQESIARKIASFRVSRGETKESAYGTISKGDNTKID